MSNSTLTPDELAQMSLGLDWIIAATRCDIEKMTKLLDSGADINFQSTASGDTALHIASQMGENVIIEFLLSQNACPNVKNKDGNTPLHVVFCWGDETQSLKLLVQSGADIEAINNEGHTPLFILANDMRDGMSEESSAMMVLLDHNANIFAKDQQNQTCADLITQNQDMFTREAIEYVQARMTQKSIQDNLNLGPPGTSNRKAKL